MTIWKDIKHYLTKLNLYPTASRKISGEGAIWKIKTS